ncbi:MAG: peptidase S8 [Gammaproteobacteria bacterium]|nr:MAG: peptidase S8 [Gammaproteobacteria bacterium]
MAAAAATTGSRGWRCRISNQGADVIGKTLHSGLACGALALSFGFVTASAQESVPAAESESGNLWFVELSGAPVADGNTLNGVRAEKAAFRKAAAAARIGYTERHSFDTLFNGFSVEVGLAGRARLATLPGVKAMYPVAVIQAPTPEISAGAAPDLAAAIAMTGADIAQDSLGYTGAGIRVGVMDTGIDYHHPDLGGCFGAGCRVAAGWDFVGDAYNADPTSAAYNPVPVPDADPDDCNGHGTHVAGILGASGAIKGVAPGATLGAYRVFGCNGSTTGDIMLAAMERALADGMQVLNMSISAPYQWPQYPTARAADRLVNKGMVVVGSFGNNGANGLYSGGAPGLGDKVIATASFDNTFLSLNSFTISPDDTVIGYSTLTDSVPAPASGSLPMARTGTTTPDADACSALTGSLTGMAVLIRRGGCTFIVKAQNAQAAGAAAVIIYNNAAGRFSGTIAGSDVTIPTVQISDTEGALIDSRLLAGPVTLSWQSGVSSFANPTGGLVSSFSSYGLSPDLAIKPDIGAPGGLIYSTFPLEFGGYGTNSGTSMTAPHVAGAAALLLQAQPHTPSQAVRGILQNSADPKNWWGNPGLGFLDNVHRQGAGLLDIDDAILATTRVEPAKIAAGESQGGPFTQTLTISNRGTGAVTYDLTSVNALSTGANTFTPSFNTSNASVAFSAANVTVPAGGSATVDATITPATAPVGGQYGGYVVLTPQGGGQVYRVPFAGYIGDYQARQVLVPTSNGFPWLAQVVGTSYFNRPAGSTYTLVGDDIPYFLLHLDHQSRRLRLEAFDANSGRAWHRISDDEYIGRNSASTSFFAFAWDGTTFTGKGKNGSQWRTVPDGQYVVKISVLKALGDENNPAHWESWTSPVITIDRP